MKHTKRLLAVLLTLVLLCTCVPFAFAEDVTIVDSGYCGAESDGTNLSWTLDSEGTLTISGEGEMSWDVFANNKMIKVVIINEGVTSIGENAFNFCTNLTTVDIPETVTTIKAHAFHGCTNLKSIRLPASLTKVESSAFLFCLKCKVYFGKSVVNISPDAFCTVNSFEVDEENPIYSSQNGLLLNKEKTTLLQYPAGLDYEAFAIPDGLKTVSQKSFLYSINLSCVEIPESVARIEDFAFFNCLRLDSIIIKGMTVQIGKNALGFSELRMKNIPNDLKKEVLLTAFELIEPTEITQPYINDIENYFEFPNDSSFYLGTIHCHAGSTAEAYAIEHGMDYELVHFYEDYVSTTAPTCTEQGYSTYKCIYCDETENRDFVEPLDHDYIDHDALNPTCTETGWEAYQSCSRCDYTTYEEKPANGHTEVVDKAVASTCTESGLTEGLHCSVCSDILVEQQIVPAHGHDFALGEIIDAKCSEDGQKIYVCKYDATHTRSEPIPATGNHVDADNNGKCDTCNQKMTGGKHCKYCGKIHGRAFGWLVKFFHSILAIFKR